MATLPPLENGDHLTRDEFERRYDAMPGLKKAELIEGVVYLPAPRVPLRGHGGPHAKLVGWLGVYSASTPGADAADSASVRLDHDNMPQPDALLMIEPGRGGQARISEDDYIEGAPELVAEVAASRVSIDLHLKSRVYRRSGVREYVVWRVRDRQIDWFALRQGEFVRLDPDGRGCYRSQVFPGLWLDAAALVNGDMAAVLAALQRGVESPEHREFVQTLQQRPRGE